MFIAAYRNYQLHNDQKSNQDRYISFYARKLWHLLGFNQIKGYLSLVFTYKLSQPL